MKLIALRNALNMLVELGLGNSDLVLPVPPEISMSFCRFQGPCPKEYKGWGEFIAAPMKTGVLVRALTEKDLNPRRPAKRRRK